MENNSNYCVILAGGMGRRLWPCSTMGRPKQFLDFFGSGETLLQQTYRRCRSLVPAENIFVSTYKEYAHFVREQLPELADSRLLCEPVQLGTAPAVAWANWYIGQIDPKANIIATPADLHILNAEAFRESVARGFSFVANDNSFLALAVKPTMPETGYGYIQLSDKSAREGFAQVKSFTEKPDLRFAKMFIDSGEFVWNTGLFMWNVQTMSQAFERLVPVMMEKLRQTPAAGQDACETAFTREYYPSSIYLSIDLIILEKSANVYVECGKFGWADLGQWGSLYDVAEKDSDGNAIINNRVINHSCHNNIIKLPSGKVAVIQGLDGYILAEEGNVILVCKKDDASMVRRLINEAQMTLQ